MFHYKEYVQLYNITCLITPVSQYFLKFIFGV